MTAHDLRGWVPIRLYCKQEELWLDWCFLGERQLSEPFFDQAIEACLQRPFNLVFRRQTPIDVLEDFEAAHTGLSPDGFIFHLSRCGSTLMAQMLASLDDSIVVSEPSVMSALLGLEAGQWGISEPRRLLWLRGLVAALGQVRDGERRYFIKWDPWHTVHLPLIRRAFPGVPWVFLYREPVEVLVSLSRSRGRMQLPGAIDPALLGLDTQSVWTTPPDEYNARMLARICATALEGHRSGQSLLVNYCELPDVMWCALRGCFGYEPSAPEMVRLQARAGFGGKLPESRFSGDSAEKSRLATAEVRAAAARWVEPRYRELEAQRAKQVFLS